MRGAWERVQLFCIATVFFGCGSTTETGRSQTGTGGAPSSYDAGAGGSGGALVGSGGASVASGGAEGGSDAGARGSGAPRCVPGDQQSCACAAGVAGIHRCDAEGHWQACIGCMSADSGVDAASACSQLTTRCGTSCVDLDTDPQNCGFCAHDCRGATCAFGLCAPTLLAEHQARPTSLAIDGTYLYWTNGGAFPPGDVASGSVVRMPLRGGDVQTLAKDQYGPAGISVNDSSVFWLVGGPGGTLDGGLRMVAKAGGMPAELAGGGMAYSGATVADADAVYWVNATSDVQKFTFATSMISTVNGTGGSAQGTALVLHDGRLYWPSGDGNDPGLAFAFVSGGAPTTIVTGDDVYAIAVDSRFVYFTRYREGTVNRVSKLGDNKTILADGQGMPLTVAVDDRRVYWTTMGGAVRSKNIDGTGEVATVAVGQGTPNALVLDSENLYFVDTDGGTVVKLTK